MEQYEILPGSCLRDVRKLLSQQRPVAIFIRRRGSMGGAIILNQDLSNASFAIKKRGSALIIVIDGKEVFEYQLDEITKGKIFTCAYTRVGTDGGRAMYSGPLPDPNDSQLPPVKESTLRSANKGYLMEITFLGKIALRRTRCFMLPSLPYWRMVL